MIIVIYIYILEYTVRSTSIPVHYVGGELHLSNVKVKHSKRDIIIKWKIKGIMKIQDSRRPVQKSNHGKMIRNL